MLESFPIWLQGIIGGTGVTGLFFLAWFLTQKFVGTMFQRFTSLQREEREAQIAAMKEERVAMRDELRLERDRQFALIREERERDYNAQDKIADALQVMSAQLASMNSEIKSHGKDITEIKHFIYRGGQ